MALISCPECKAEISSTAPTCPRCGAPQKKKTSRGVMLLAILLGLGFLGSLKNGGSTSTSSSSAKLTPEQAKAERERKAAEEELSSAKYACKYFVKQSLHDPDSAEFENALTWWSEKQSDGTYHVQVKVRARNAFNALRQTVMDCKTKRNGKDWVALSLKQLDT